MGRSSNPKQEVTGNTEALVNTDTMKRAVCLRLRDLKKTNNFPQQSAVPVSARETVGSRPRSTLLHLFNIQDQQRILCSVSEGAVYESRLVHVVADAVR